MADISIIFKKEQIDFLLIHLKNQEILPKLSQAFNENKIYENNYSTDRYLINISSQETEILIDELTSLLCLIGFKNSEEVNNDGITIENLLDLLTNLTCVRV